MNIEILTVGKIKEKFLKEAIKEYEKRMNSYAKVKIHEVSEQKAPESLSKAEENQVKIKEGRAILEKIKAEDYVILLEIEGTMWDSQQLSDKLQNLGMEGVKRVVFVIGGSLGVSEEVKKRANDKLSFSKMTFPHQLMRVILLEQIYRGYRIMEGHPYHK